MQTFPVLFSRNVTVSVIVLVVPMVVAAALTTLTLTMSRVPEWMVLVSSVVMLGTMLGCILILYRKYAAIRAEVDMDTAGITIRLLKRSPFYARAYNSTWAGIENLSSNIDLQEARRFYVLRFRKRGISVTLTPSEKVDADTETPFGTALLDYVSAYNTAHQLQPDTIIHRRGYYDAWWAKLITFSCFLLIAVAIILRVEFPRIVTTWRLIQVLLLNLVWMGTYYTNKKRSA